MIQRQDKYGNTSTDLGPVLVYDRFGKLKKLGGAAGTGPQGPQGPAGGPQGNQGPQGTQGRQGSQGDMGLQGYQGDQGDQGTQGFQGNLGPQGNQGDQGTQGNRGFQGFQGNQGTQGVQGFQGTQGNQGFKGDQGFQGNQGTQGVQGFQGTQGNQGFKGDQGFQGNQGVQGFQGPQGFQGTQGNQGFKGDQGFQGNQGNSGISSGAVYYFNQSQSSDVSTYSVLSTIPSGTAQQIVLTGLSGSQLGVLVNDFITPQLGFSVIPGGTQRFHLHYLKQASNDSIEAYVQIQLANSVGNPIPGTIFQTGTSLIGWVDATTPAEVTLDLTLSTTTIDPTNRMIVRLYLSNLDNNVHNVKWYTEGTSYYSFVMTTVGVIGNQGPAGDQGPQGTQGFQGVQGPQGFQGVQGDQGPQGFQGDQGTQGFQGPQGVQGTQGDQGYQGTQGDQGYQGYQGDQGYQGVQGDQGYQGVQGYQGPQGFQGTQGFQGPSASLSPSNYVVKAVKGGSAQTIPSNSPTDTIITFVDDYDPQGWWTPNRFQPTIPGYYNLQLAVWWDAGSVTNNQSNIQILKNGIQVAIQQNQILTGSGYGQEIDTIVEFNGSTDYVEATAFTGNTTSQNINGASSGTWFTAALITNGTGPQGVQGSTGATPSIPRSFGITMDGGGNVIPTGIQGDIQIPYSMTINSWTLIADTTGSIVVDVWKDTYANYPATVADTITGSAKPTISSSNKAQSSTLTGWTTSVNAGDIIRFNVDSVSTITKATLIIQGLQV